MIPIAAIAELSLDMILYSLWQRDNGEYCGDGETCKDGLFCSALSDSCKPILLNGFCHNTVLALAATSGDSRIEFEDFTVASDNDDWNKGSLPYTGKDTDKVSFHDHTQQYIQVLLVCVYSFLFFYSMELI